MKKLLSILKYLVPYWVKALLSVILNLLAAIFSVISFTMVIPFLGLLFSTQQFIAEPLPFSFTVESIKHNFNFYLGKVVAEKGQLDALLFIILAVLVFTILKNIFLFLGKILVIQIRINVVKDIRNDLMDRILNFDLSYFSREKRGDIITKMIVDVKEIELSVISSLEMFFKDPILILVYLYVLIFMNLKLTLIVVIIFPVSALIIGLVGKSLKKVTLRGQQRMGALVGMLEETLLGIKIVKAFNAEGFVKKRFWDLNQRYSNLFNKVWGRRALANPVSDIISTISILLVMWFGGKMILTQGGNFTSQVFIAYLAVFTQVISPAKSITNAYYNILKGMASIDRIDSILLHKFKITEKSDAIQIAEFKDSIEFKNVVFHYEDNTQPTINNVSFIIKKGETIALVGSSGAGKTTIVDLLPRFFDPVSGEILIDGKSLKDYGINSLRSLFGYVNQQAVLFNDTIYNNILFGNYEQTKEQVELAAKMAFAHDFIVKKEMAYETNLGESGDMLSLGEKQRISIARAILKNPPILILDEATSALDYESELTVRKALGNLMEGRTTIVIAHRLSTIKKADKIFVVEDGKIVEQGTHEELLAANAYYTKLTNLEYL